MGRVCTGVAIVESTASSAPAACAASAASAMSTMSHMGLAGVSIHTRRVLPGMIARPIAPEADASTNVTSIPRSLGKRFSQARSEKYIDSPETT